MRLSSRGVLVPRSLAELLSDFPWEHRGNTTCVTMDSTTVQLDWCALPELIDSANASIAFWQQVLQLLKTHYNDYQGFVILHGTDSMAYTASALSFALTGLAKPVVFTGAQIPLGLPKSDALPNLKLAIMAALRAAALPEVCIAFASRVLRGNRARKVHSTHKAAFGSPNYAPLYSAGRWYQKRIMPRPSVGDITVAPNFNSAVSQCFYTPGMCIDACVTQLQQPGVAGVVVHSLGSGNLPTDKQMLDAFDQMHRQGIIVLHITQCIKGGVVASRYATASALAEVGVVSGADMTPEAAATKLMWVLANSNASQASACLATNQRGEMQS